jgi:hypothetical protein
MLISYRRHSPLALFPQHDIGSLSISELRQVAYKTASLHHNLSKDTPTPRLTKALDGLTQEDVLLFVIQGTGILITQRLGGYITCWDLFTGLRLTAPLYLGHMSNSDVRRPLFDPAGKFSFNVVLRDAVITDK